MKKILTLSIALILIAGIVSLAESANIDTSNTTEATAEVKDRHIVQSSNGTIVVLYQGSSSPAGIRAKKSTDKGATWTDLSGGAGSTQISSTTYTDYSICIDASDNIYVTYPYSSDIYFKKLTYNVSASTWTVGSERTVDSENDNASPYIIRESGGKIWVAYAHDTVDGAQVVATYSTDEFQTSGTRTDVSSAQAGSSELEYEAAMTIRSGNPFIVFQDHYDSYKMKWSSWNGSSWSSPQQILSMYSVGAHFSLTLVGTTVHLVVETSYGVIDYTYYDGSWHTAETLISGEFHEKPSLTTNDSELWCFASIYYDDPNSSYNKFNIKYKKRSGSTWDASWTAITTDNRVNRNSSSPSISKAYVPLAWTDAISPSPYTVKFDYSVVVDTTPPGPPTGVTANPSVYTATNSFGFSWTAPSDPSGINHYHYSVNSTPNSGSSSTTNTSLSPYAAATQQGENTFYVVAEDNAGNINYSNYGTCKFYYDSTAPTTPGTPSTTTPTNNNKPTWTWTASTDAHSGLRTTNTYIIYWDTVAGGEANSAYSNTNSYTHTVGLSDGTWYAKVRAYDAVNNPSAFSGNGSVVIDTTAPAAITDLAGVCDDATGDVTLSWSTPGDDGWTGTLVNGSKYRIDYSTYSIQWSTTTYDVEIPTSSVAPYTKVSYTITGLTENTSWYFRIWTRDEVSNWSGLSNGTTVWVWLSVADVTAPAAITDLSGQCDSGTGDVTLSWSTPGDDGWTGTLVNGSKYIIDYSTYSIQWSTTTYDVEIPTHSVAPYTEVSYKKTGLTENTSWYFRIWTADEVSNWSGLSNGATVWVWVVPDVTAPAAITDLTGLCDDATGDVTLSWSTPGDDGWIGTLVNGSKYIIDYSTYSIQWSTTTYDVEIPTNSVAPYTKVSYKIAGLTKNTSWYFRIWTADEVSNWSGLSNGATVWVWLSVADLTPPSYSSFESQKSDGIWISASEWNDDLTPNTRVKVQDTGSGLRIGSSEVSPDTHTVLLLHLNSNTTDYSGYGNHGTRYGGVDWISTDTWRTVGGTDPILYFDGVDDYVDCGTNSILNFTSEDFTISAWVLTKSISTQQQIFNRGTYSTNGYYFQLVSSKLELVTSQSGAGQYTQSIANPFSQNTWANVVAVRQGSTVRIYVNGSEVSYAVKGSHSNPATDAGPAYIGCYSDNSLKWNGMIDEVRVLNRALSAEEIAADYYSGLFKYSKDGGSTWYSVSGSTVAWSTGTVTGVNGSTNYETVYASNVPFNQYSETQNKIKFLIDDINGNVASSAYTVIIGSVTVSAYTAGTPDVPPSTVEKGSTGNCLGTFRFNGAGTISQLTITEYGTCDADGDLENVKLYKDDGDGNWESGQDTQLGSTTNFNSSDKATFSFSLVASTYCYVHVVLDVKSTAQVNNTIGIELYQNGIVCTSTTTASSWPVQLGTSTITGETTPPSYSSFESQKSDGIWISASEWNDDLTPNTRVKVQDTGSGLRIGSSEVSPDTHTVLLLHLNNNTTDYSGYGNNGTRYGGVDWISTDTWKTIGGTENILYFDGVDDYVDCGTNSILNFTSEDFTISAWVLTKSISTQQQIFNRGTYNTNGYYVQLYNSCVELATNQSGAYQQTRSIANPFSQNTWANVVAVRQGSTAKIYVNGSEVSYGLQGNHSNPASDAGPVYIGCYYDNSLKWNGMIDEVRVLNRALSAEEVAADYYSGLFRYSKDGGNTWYSVSGSTVAWSTGTVTGVNGSTNYETVYASNVPFNQYSETLNKIKFLIDDIDGNIAESSAYTVIIGSVTVSAYTAGTPDVPPSTVEKGSTGNCLGTFRFNGAGTISQLTITEYGTCDANSELENVKLFKDNGNGNWESGQDTNQLGSTTNFSGTSSTATFSGFSLVASTYCYVHVVLDVKSTAQSDNTIGIELYQNGIVCTSTTTASSWPVQLGTSTITGETTPPAAITDLTGLCDSDTGDVTLSWSTPGDNGWNDTLPEGSGYRIDYSTYSKQWNKDDYELWIPTSGVAPYTKVSRVITGLTGDTTWYFQIWTRDEVPNWSGLSNGATVWVNPILSVSISTDTYNFGEFSASTTVVSTANIAVTNDGNISETYSIKCSSSTKWTPDSTPGSNKFTLQAAFHPSQPNNDDISWKADDILTESLQQCTTAAFSIDNSQSGKNVLPFESNIRDFWLRLKTPLGTSTTVQQIIPLTISAEQGSP